MVHALSIVRMQTRTMLLWDGDIGRVSRDAWRSAYSVYVVASRGK